MAATRPATAAAEFAPVGFGITGNQLDELCNYRFDMIQRVYGTSAAYMVMGWALKWMARPPWVVLNPCDFAIKLLEAAERAIVAEGYDVLDERDRPSRLGPAFPAFYRYAGETA